MMESSSRLLLMTALVGQPCGVAAELICDPESAHLFLSAGAVQDRLMQLGSWPIDTRVAAPTVVLECVTANKIERDEAPCGQDVQKVIVTWHAEAGQVEAECLPGSVDISPPVVPPTGPDESETGGNNSGTNFEGGGK